MGRCAARPGRDSRRRTSAGQALAAGGSSRPRAAKRLARARKRRAGPLAGPGSQTAPPGEGPLASTRPGFSAPPLEGLEPEAASTRRHDPAALPRGGGTGRAWPRSQPAGPAFTPLPCEAWRMTATPWLSGWRARLVPRGLLGGRAAASASRQAWPSRSAWRRRTFRCGALGVPAPPSSTRLPVAPPAFLPGCSPFLSLLPRVSLQLPLFLRKRSDTPRRGLCHFRRRAVSLRLFNLLVAQFVGLSTPWLLTRRNVTRRNSSHQFGSTRKSDGIHSAWLMAPSSLLESNVSMGKPPGLDAVLSMSGGTAPTSTALATREEP